MPNKLIHEQSPYLLQHANNPVNWYPWGDEAFEKAIAENKPVLVSIGYAACHWCHVMEHESFESESVAAYMNEHFVCIKVDREEHPDVDHMYMDAVQAIGGSGGWPLNVFVTPERAPFYGGTYYPPRAAYNRPSWMQLLQRMTELWEDEHDQVTQQAEQMIQHLRQASQRMTFLKKDGSVVGKEACSKIAENLLKQADKEQGGFGNAPKFPGTMAISFLLEHNHFTGHKPSLQHALRSLDAMSDGGIYDQLGGGFARYATDRNWLIPHFEKMLYDNALLINSLCDAYSMTMDDRYKATANETIAFIERELRDKSGGYYCALDADSEGVEGKFYTWVWDDWISALGGNDALAAEYFGVSEHGNWEETNILHVAKSKEQLAAKNKLSIEEVTVRIEAVKQKLLAVRDTRVRPMTDDKCLLSWNALYNIALSKAGVVFRNEDYLQRATAHMRWMITQFDKSGKLLRTWKNGTAKIAAKLDDYAYLIQAQLQLASATGANDLVLKASELVAIVDREFNTGSLEHDVFFYYTAESQKDIPVRKVDLYDGATPSANAVMAHNLWLCGMCMEKSEWIQRAQMMWQNMNNTAVRYSQSFGCWALMLQRQAEGLKTVVCAGINSDKFWREIQERCLPQSYLLTSQKEISELPIFEKKFFADKMYIFVCTEQACLSPVSGVEEALCLINNL
jgi:hypothetical protein